MWLSGGRDKSRAAESSLKTNVRAPRFLSFETDVHSRVFTFSLDVFFSVSVESYDSAHDYEKVDGEKAEHATHANLGDHLYEDSFQGEPFGGGTFKDEDEADYVNVTTECNVQFVEIYGEGVSSPNVLVLNAPSEDEEFIDIYGEEDCIYQNMGLG